MRFRMTHTIFRYSTVTKKISDVEKHVCQQKFHFTLQSSISKLFPSFQIMIDYMARLLCIRDKILERDSSQSMSGVVQPKKRWNAGRVGGDNRPQYPYTDISFAQVDFVHMKYLMNVICVFFTNNLTPAPFSL